LWIYYTGSRNPARGYDEWQHRIGLAVMPRDRFVSIDGMENVGGLVTRPLDFEGDTLHLNVDAARGQVRVAVLDESGNELQGLGMEECVVVEQDALDCRVQWKEGKSLNEMGRVRLKFELRQASLFSFWID